MEKEGNGGERGMERKRGKGKGGEREREGRRRERRGRRTASLFYLFYSSGLDYLSRTANCRRTSTVQSRVRQGSPTCGTGSMGGKDLWRRCVLSVE